MCLSASEAGMGSLMYPLQRLVLVFLEAAYSSKHDERQRPPPMLLLMTIYQFRYICYAPGGLLSCIWHDRHDLFLLCTPPKPSELCVRNAEPILNPQYCS